MRLHRPKSKLTRYARRRLARKFTHLPADQISAEVRQTHAHFKSGQVRDSVPLLVERGAVAELSRDASLVAASGQHDRRPEIIGAVPVADLGGAAAPALRCVNRFRPAVIAVTARRVDAPWRGAHPGVGIAGKAPRSSTRPSRVRLLRPGSSAGIGGPHRHCRATHTGPPRFGTW